MIKAALIVAITKIAQHACRNGESGARAWPHLRDLPDRLNWRMVGEKYAAELLEELGEHALEEEAKR